MCLLYYSLVPKEVLTDFYQIYLKAKWNEEQKKYLGAWFVYRAAILTINLVFHLTSVGQ